MTPRNDWLLPIALFEVVISATDFILTHREFLVMFAITILGWG